MKLVDFGFVFILFGVSNGWLILDSDLDLSSNADRFTKLYSKALFRDAGEPLYITEYLNENKVSEARNASFVPPFVDNVESYSGFFTVDKKYNSNMFFWYVPAEESPETAPVILWLQGGPGGSSLYGLFVEHGPYMIAKDGSITKRDVYWSKTMHVLYIDNPVGTGFSFTDSDEGYSKDEVTIGKNLYSCLQQFYRLFPELRSNEFFISGESYAGKYIPALGYTIHQNNLQSDDKINLKGLAIGNGLTDPLNQWDYGSYLKGIGLIDETQKEEFEYMQDNALDAISRNDHIEAFIIYNKILGKVDSLFHNITGYEYVYNYLISYNVPFDSRYVSFLNTAAARKSIHVGSLNYEMISRRVYFNLIKDFSTSVAEWVAILADHYNLMMYNGGLDIVVPYPSTVNYVTKLKWCGSEELANAERKVWTVDGQIAGYMKTSSPAHCKGSVRLVMVRNAGHTVPEDQPIWAYNLITDFTNLSK